MIGGDSLEDAVAFISGDVVRYAIRIASPVHGHVSWVAAAHLDTDAPARFSLAFYDDDVTLAENKKVSDDPILRYNIYFHRRDYAGIVDLLRNEKPLQAVFNDQEASFKLMTRHWEPVGEDE